MNSFKTKPNSSEIEANFLSSYYNQDGNNSPVTGGVGTEALTDFANVFIVNVPIDSINSIGFYGGADAYTSASTDNIDSNVSSASVNDVRIYGTLSYNRKNLKRGETYGVRGGYSKEFDYESLSAGVSITKEWNEGNTELNLTGQAFFDKWLGKDGSNSLIYPEFWLGEAFGYKNLSTPNRNSFNAQLFLSQVINPRLQIGLSAEFIYMTGLLSTPFHSVYFVGKEDFKMDIERLPASRLKLPFGVRLNYYPIDFLVLRTYYRYYTDDFGINAHSLEVETPLKLNSSFTIAPFYRFHTQSGSKYFAPKNVHVAPSEPNSTIYYTSDYDLSALNAHKFGFGLKYYPAYGLLRSRPFLDRYGVVVFKYIELRTAMYKRSTDLSAFNVSINLAFTYK
ncbi:MAG: hypothetical protein AUK44_04525 [Porphyromonadaceae bacterium CG2_30_38_12]|nr:MAG: hypothetical protein AUK44_04525 [Porphyromonadaceae bacterium CG2_30_38_12]